MNYLKKRKSMFLLLFFCCISYNLYFIYLVPGADKAYLIYLDRIMAVLGVILIAADIWSYKKSEAEKKIYLKSEGLICDELGNFENREIAAHDVEILKKQLEEQFDANCNLEDYIAKWCHEIKLPLAAGLLLTEKMENPELKESMSNQLERMNQMLRQALLGCKVQSSMFDLKIRQVKLMDCVRTSLQNHRFFLLRGQFELEIRVEELTVYTDQSWLVYVLDQLISNAVKYARENPLLQVWTEQVEQRICLFVEDNGEGILQQDITRIFEKGFTGSNHQNGQYKSTGMGLYMVSVILKKLGHMITVESEYGQYTRFMIEFRDNRDYAEALQKM
ncbi:MAG: sensor histidine kinase [Hespellia sp.]|nr:sensor histidine kinase [Hespellia sp.]